MGILQIVTFLVVVGLLVNEIVSVWTKGETAGARSAEYWLTETRKIMEETVEPLRKDIEELAQKQDDLLSRRRR